MQSECRTRALDELDSCNPFLQLWFFTNLTIFGAFWIFLNKVSRRIVLNLCPLNATGSNYSLGKLFEQEWFLLLSM
jgi:hypothetical protein